MGNWLVIRWKIFFGETKSGITRDWLYIYKPFRIKSNIFLSLIKDSSKISKVLIKFIWINLTSPNIKFVDHRHLKLVSVSKLVFMLLAQQGNGNRLSRLRMVRFLMHGLKIKWNRSLYKMSSITEDTHVDHILTQCKRYNISNIYI